MFQNTLNIFYYTGCFQDETEFRFRVISVALLRRSKQKPGYIFRRENAALERLFSSHLPIKFSPRVMNDVWAPDVLLFRVLFPNTGTTPVLVYSTEYYRVSQFIISAFLYNIN